MNEQKVRQLFELAMERPPEARASFLQRLCGDSPEMLDRVMALVRAEGEIGDYLARPTASGEPEAEPEAGERAGTTIGKFKLLQEIGEGGMGAVWMAEQFDPVRRKVALKVIKLGMDTKQVVARFEAERQALALMDHPSIAKVLDGGMTDQGRPYFVMELVKGVPITTFCDEAKLDLGQRLELFTQVCQAVQHAHQKGIIHRDLKPSNVLVTLHDGVPVPKVIDFGIAKATNQELTQKTLFTEYAQILGTPEYMAPEQAAMSGLDIDTRADIYSLGVMLYELLTGAKPFDLKTLLSQGYEELLRTIREVDPPKPSTRASSTDDETGLKVSIARQMRDGQLGKALRGDLDWIVIKAMEKDRTRRYQSANGFAADIVRFLADEPVVATPPSAAYRMRKFVRRNRGPVLAASLVLAVLVLGIVGTVTSLVRAVAEKERAERAERASARELARANEVKRLVKGMFMGISPEMAAGMDTTLLTSIIDASAARLAGGEVEDELIAAELHVTLGHAYSLLARFATADSHLVRGGEIFERRLGRDSVETIRARWRLMTLRFMEGRHGTALRMGEEVQGAIVKALGPEAEETLMFRAEFSELYRHQNRYEEAEALARRTRETIARLLGKEHNAYLVSSGNLASALVALERFDEARAILSEDYPGIADTNRLKFENALVVMDARTGRYEQAVERAVRLEPEFDRFYGPRHPDTVRLLANRMHWLRELGRAEDVLRLYPKARDAAADLAPDQPVVAEIEMEMAAAQIRAGDGAGGAKRLREICGVLARDGGLGEQHVRNFFDRSITLLHGVRLFQAAAPLSRQLLAEHAKQHGPDDERTLCTQARLAVALAGAGEIAEAKRMALGARQGLLRRFEPGHKGVVTATVALSTVHLAQREYVEAGRLLENNLPNLKTEAERTGSYHQLVFVARMRRDWPAAEKWSRARTKAMLALHGPEFREVITSRVETAIWIKMQRRFPEAIAMLETISDDTVRLHGGDSALAILVQGELGLALGANREFDRARATVQAARESAEKAGLPALVTRMNGHLQAIENDAKRAASD